MGAKPYNFEAFDTKKTDEYAAQVKASWGHTEAYKEFEKKAEGRSREETQALSREMMEIFAEIGRIKKKDPGSEEAVELVEKLQSFISEHFYTCTKEILKGLGMMYAAPGEMADNIDQYGGKGTAAFAAKAIEEYCKEA